MESTTGKRWWLYILPQYLANLIHIKTPNLYNVCPCMKDIVYARFEDFVTLLFVFVNVVKVLMRLELYG